jgi:hypothetical protein
MPCPVDSVSSEAHCLLLAYLLQQRPFVRLSPQTALHLMNNVHRIRAYEVLYSCTTTDGKGSDNHGAWLTTAVHPTRSPTDHGPAILIGVVQIPLRQL